MRLWETASTEFLNVDLDIQAERGLSALLSELEVSMVVLNKTETAASLELAENGDRPDEVIVAMVRVVRQLSKEARSIWDQCDKRSFNIGFQGGKTPREKLFPISSETIALLAGIRGEIVMTVYACPE